IEENKVFITNANKTSSKWSLVISGDEDNDEKNYIKISNASKCAIILIMNKDEHFYTLARLNRLIKDDTPTVVIDDSDNGMLAQWRKTMQSDHVAINPMIEFVNITDKLKFELTTNMLIQWHVCRLHNSGITRFVIYNDL